MVDAPETIGLVASPFGLRLWNREEDDSEAGAIRYLRADITERQLAEARADAKLFEATAKEAARGLECLNDIDEAWDAFGTAANRGTLTLAEQISSVSRELDAAETERDRLAAEVERLREALTETADALESRLTDDEKTANIRKPYEHPLSAYDRARATLRALHAQERRDG